MSECKVICTLEPTSVIVAVAVLGMVGAAKSGQTIVGAD
jgi:hypothetical protein